MSCCDWKDSKERQCPAPGTVRQGNRWLCSGHSKVQTSAEGERVLDDLLKHGVMPTGNLSDVVAERAGQLLGLDRVAKMRARRQEGFKERALKIYRGTRRALQGGGMSEQDAHENAVAEVYCVARLKQSDATRYEVHDAYTGRVKAGG